MVAIIKPLNASLYGPTNVYLPSEFIAFIYLKTVKCKLPKKLSYCGNDKGSKETVFIHIKVVA